MHIICWITTTGYSWTLQRFSSSYLFIHCENLSPLQSIVTNMNSSWQMLISNHLSSLQDESIWCSELLKTQNSHLSKLATLHLGKTNTLNMSLYTNTSSLLFCLLSSVHSLWCKTCLPYLEQTNEHVCTNYKWWLCKHIQTLY